MKSVLVVGYVPYEKRKEIVKKNADSFLIFESGISDACKPQIIIEAVRMVDEVMFVNATKNDKLSYEVACVMLHKPMTDYTEEEVEKDDAI